MASRGKEQGLAAPDSVTFVSLLQACASVGTLALVKGRKLHAQIGKQGLQADVVVGCSLVNMYPKCGSLQDAQSVFDSLNQKNVATWTTLITGYMQQGMGQEALIAGYTRQGDSESVFPFFHRMKESGIQPDSITFLSVLTGCSHAGLVSNWQEYFEAMSRQYGISPAVEHYTCMVDLLGRAGDLDMALAVVLSMPVQPHIAVWHTLLSACRKWTNVAIGRHAFSEAVKLGAKDAAAYVLMSMIYSGAQMWEEAQEM